MNKKALSLALLAVGMVPLAWAATRCEVRNRNSLLIYVMVRSGEYQNCDQNKVVWQGNIGANSSITVPYGGDVTQVCAWERLGNGWSAPHATSCPSSDNSLCYINMN